MQDINNTYFNAEKTSLSFHVYCIFMLITTTFLIYAGGFTTSINAGMAFLDWPLSNGSLNPEGWIRDKDMAAEHSHRLLGMQLGILSIVLVVWSFATKTSRRIRFLAISVLSVVVLQGMLGGLRVLLDRQNIDLGHNFMGRGFAVMHACGAQIVVCLITSLIVTTSKKWVSSVKTEKLDNSIYTLGVIASALIFFQVFLGALMRHAKAALAIPYFPFSTSDNSFLPVSWNWMVSLNFAHRVGAIVVTVVLVMLFYKLWKSSSHRNYIGYFVYVPAVFLFIQIYLGALVIWSYKNEHAATFHTITGAFLLSSCWAVTYMSKRLCRKTSKKKIVQYAT